MQYVRLAMMVLMCACLTGIARSDEAADEKEEHETAKAVLAKAKIDLTKAIEAAQAEVPKGKPIYAVTAQGKNSIRYNVFLWVGDSVTEVKVDAVSGKVKETEEQEDDEVDDLDGAKKVLEASKITFAQAIATAKAKVEGGKPFAIETEFEDGKSIIVIEFIAGEKVMVVEVDAVTGEVFEVEEETD